MPSVQGVTRFATVALAAALVATCAQSAGAGASGPAPGQPRPGRVLLGVVGPDPAAFDRLTRHVHKLHLVFVNGGGSALSETLEADRADGRITIVTLNGQSSPAALARGDSDVLLVVTSKAANAVGTPVWIRPVPEMNGHWSQWAAFDRSGRPRGAEFTTAQIKQAFRRIALIMRGGPVGQDQPPPPHARRAASFAAWPRPTSRRAARWRCSGTRRDRALRTFRATSRRTSGRGRSTSTTSETTSTRSAAERSGPGWTRSTTRSESRS